MSIQTSSYEPRVRRRWVIFVGAIAFLAANAIGYLAYRAAAPPDTAAVDHAAAAERSRQATKPSLDGFRIAGIKALEMGDYDAAAASFARALEGDTKDSDLEELLAMAEKLSQREKDQARVLAQRAAERTTDPPRGPPRETVEVKGDSPTVTTDRERNTRSRRGRSRRRRKSAHRVAASPPPEPEPVVAEPEEELPGLLIITPTPGKFLVKVDDEPKDLTPARVEVPAGSYTVTLYHENEKLYSKRVRVKAGGVKVVRPDLRDKLQPPETQEAPPPAVKPRQKPVISARGEVSVLSPNVYGEIWINGASYGYPPRVVKKLPVGRTVVEIRVQGAVRRKKTVQVERDTRTTLRFR